VPDSPLGAVRLHFTDDRVHPGSDHSFDPPTMLFILTR